jgi:hypothetical protein
MDERGFSTDQLFDLDPRQIANAGVAALETDLESFVTARKLDVVGRVGIEPTTKALKGPCSTN